MHRIVTRLALGSLALLVCLTGFGGWQQAEGQGVTDDMLAAEAGVSWLHVNGNWAGHRYSTLNQVNASNAGDLRVAWIYSTGGDTDAQCTPIYYDGLMYIAQDNTVHAVDAATGRQVWKYEHELPEDFGGYNVPFFTGKHRGVAIAGEHIYFLSNDMKLHAMHYKTGEQKFVQQYLDYPKAFEKSEDANGYFATVGPLAIPGQIIVPMNATDTGGLPGYVYGVSQEDGSILYEANMIPGPDEPGYESWPGDSRDYGGAGPWITGSWDADLKMYYTGTANAYPWNPKTRGDGKMDNVGAASIVAVDTDTGRVPWRYVAVPGDPWDFDVPQTPLIITLNGRKTIVHPNKTGYIHYIDAETGQYQQAVAFSDKITWAKGYDVEGRPIDQVAVPEEGTTIEMWPSLAGGVNLYPAAYNPLTGYVYLPAIEMGMEYTFEEIKVISNVQHFGASFEFLFSYELNLAMDVRSGAEVWRDQKGKSGYAGGMLTTAGDLVFYGSETGQFQAVNASTGDILYTFQLGARPKSGPITYVLNGKQYVAQLTGGGSTAGYEASHLEHGGHIVAFTR